MERLKATVLMAFVLTTIVAGAVQASTNAKPVSAPLSVSIALQAASMKAGSPVKVDLKLTNATSFPITLDEKFLVPYYIEVRNADGNLAALTEEGKEWKRRFDFRKLIPSMAQYEIQPGDTIKEEYAVSDLYDMSNPGIYTIQFHRDSPLRGQADSHSNVVTVTITPQPKAIQ